MGGHEMSLSLLLGLILKRRGLRSRGRQCKA